LRLRPASVNVVARRLHLHSAPLDLLLHGFDLLGLDRQAVHGGLIDALLASVGVHDEARAGVERSSKLMGALSAQVAEFLANLLEEPPEVGHCRAGILVAHQRLLGGLSLIEDLLGRLGHDSPRC
jgi:hypothetical protein